MPAHRHISQPCALQLHFLPVTPEESIILQEMATFEYSPLEKPRDVRLIFLEPAPDPSSPIVCSLHLANLDDQNIPKYEALSYVWGSSADKQPINCEGSILRVTRNLLCALQRLRLPDCWRVLWIDAICINQEDLAERSVQVQWMRDIFRGAQAVLAWWGEGDDLPVAEVSFGKPLSLRLLQTLATMEMNTSWPGTLPNLKRNVQELRLARKQVPELRWPALNPDLSILCRALMKTRTDATQLITNTLNALINCEWFSRMWILQEAVVGKTKIMLGAYSITWSAFGFLLQDYRKPRIHRTNENMSAFMRFKAIRNQRRLFGTESHIWDNDHQVDVDVAPGGSGFTGTTLRVARDGSSDYGSRLHSLLRLSQMFKCSDLRDKVYALYGLVDLKDSLDGIQPDYTLPVEEVYRKVAKHVIQQEKRLDIWTIGTHRSMTNLPSWVPDWSVSSDEGRLGIEHSGRWSAYWSTSYAQLTGGSTENADELSLMGCVIDVVATVASCLRTPNTGDGSIVEEDFTRILGEWEHVAATTFSGLSRKAAICRFIGAITRQPHQNDDLMIAFSYWYERHGAGVLASDASLIGNARGTWSHYDILCLGDNLVTGQLLETTPESGGASTPTIPTESTDIDEYESHQEGRNQPSDGRIPYFDVSGWRSVSDSISKPADVFHLCTQWVKRSCYGRSMYSTVRNYLGLAPPSAKAGDLVVCFPGRERPVILRKLDGPPETKQRYQLIGDCTINQSYWEGIIRNYPTRSPFDQMEEFVLR